MRLLKEGLRVLDGEPCGVLVVSLGGPKTYWVVFEKLDEGRATSSEFRESRRSAVH